MILMSNRLYPMLETFVTLGGSYYMSVETAKRYDQRPFRSMLIRGWIAFRPGPRGGFYLTREGRQAWQDYHHTEIWRKNPRLPLTRYFDADAYQLRPALVKAG